MEKLIRERCVLTNDTDMEDLFIQNNVPIFMGTTNNGANCDLRSNLHWQINKNSGMIQLKHLIDLEFLYKESHNSGLIGKIWENHHTKFAEFINEYKPKKILEIGGSHGALFNKYCDLYGPINSWTIVDINTQEKINKMAQFISTNFDYSFKYNVEFDTIVHSHFFEHVYEPDLIMKKFSEMISLGEKKMIFSIPNMESMLKNKYSNCLNFEHTYFFSEPYVEYLLHKYDFKIIKKQYFLNNHSIFYCVHKGCVLEKKELQTDLYYHNKNTFNQYIEHYTNIVKKINNSSCEFYLFGAHIFSQNLFNFGLNESKIKFILDNDINKINKRLYGSSLFIKSPNDLKNKSNPNIILCAGAYNEEIKSQIVNINPTAIFYEF